jgi:hypothetical protein
MDELEALAIIVADGDQVEQQLVEHALVGQVFWFYLEIESESGDMNFLSRYIQYLKRNPEHYWFKRKAYGWGWLPANRQGWLTLAVLVVVFF